MPWTASDVEALKTAIKSGVKSVAYSDRSVVYQSTADMLEVLAAMEAEAAGSGAEGGTRSTFASFSRD